MKDESTISQNSSITTKCNVDSRNKRITNRNTIIWDILFRTLIFILGLRFTILIYFSFFEDIPFIEGISYTILFFCAIFLLTKLLIDDKETK